MTARRLCAVSIDLDEIPCYLAIHGLPSGAVEPASRHAVYERGIARATLFARAHGLPLTLFAIGRDLDRPENVRVLRDAMADGATVESHSLSHRYDLTRLAPDDLAREVNGGAEAVASALGVRPRGFRAPGYTTNAALYGALEQAGFAWDSSVFPCPVYYAAKAAVLGAMALVGRSSASILGSPQVLFAPRAPHRVGSLVELPIAVTPRLRWPAIGTSVGLMGASGARVLARQLARDPLVNLELHGLDFLEGADGLEHLVAHEPALRVPLVRRLEAFSAFLEVLSAAGFTFVTLDEAATAHGAQVGGR